MRMRDSAGRGKWTVVLVAVLALMVALPLVSQTVKTIVIKPGDTLWDLAEQYLGSPWRWPEIWQNSKFRSGDPDLIYPGEVANLPIQEVELPLEVVEQMLKDMNDRIVALQNQVQEVQGRLEAIEGRVGQRLSNLEAGVQGVRDDLAQLSERVADVGARTAPPVVNLDAVEQRLDELDRSVAAVVKEVETKVESTSTENAAKIAQLEAELETLSKSLETQAAIQRQAIEELTAKISPPEPEEDPEIAQRRRLIGLISTVVGGLAFMIVSATR